MYACSVWISLGLVLIIFISRDFTVTFDPHFSGLAFWFSKYITSLLKFHMHTFPCVCAQNWNWFEALLSLPSNFSKWPHVVRQPCSHGEPNRSLKALHYHKSLLFGNTTISQWSETMTNKDKQIGLHIQLASSVQAALLGGCWKNITER